MYLPFVPPRRRKLTDTASSVYATELANITAIEVYILPLVQELMHASFYVVIQLAVCDDFWKAILLLNFSKYYFSALSDTSRVTSQRPIYRTLNNSHQNGLD